MQHSTTHSAKRKNASKAEQQDAVELLVSDHNAVKKLFKAYEKLAESDAANTKEKSELVQQICDELTIHTQIEEEIFYPAVRKALESDMVDEAVVEHDTLKYLMQQLEESTPSDDLYDAKVQVLSEYVEHHVKEEEEEMFPKVEKSDLDTDALGAKMLSKKEQLMKKIVH